MTDIVARLRRALVTHTVSSPTSLAWFERQRHRFLHEYHEMRARAGAKLHRVDGRLVWYGRMWCPHGGPLEYAIAYDDDHPHQPPRVFALGPAEWVTRLGAAPDGGEVQVVNQADHHAGLTAFDYWIWLRRQVFGWSDVPSWENDT